LAILFTCLCPVQLTRAAWNPTTGMEEIVQAERRSAPGRLPPIDTAT
jgi:hypothetical protein